MINKVLTPMTLTDLKLAFRNGTITPHEALNYAADHMKNTATRKEAEAFISEVVGMPAEPKSMTAAEKSAAKTWERNYRK